MPRLSYLVPVFGVADVTRAYDHYCGHLGFTVNWEHALGPGAKRFASISRDEMTIFLSEHPDPAPGAIAYVTVDDVDALAAELRERGAPIEGPFDQPWGIREIHLQDPDGNRLRIGQRTGPRG